MKEGSRKNIKESLDIFQYFLFHNSELLCIRLCKSNEKTACPLNQLETFYNAPIVAAFN